MHFICHLCFGNKSVSRTLWALFTKSSRMSAHAGDVAVAVPERPVVMTKIMKKRQVVSTAIHAAVNSVIYMAILQYIGISFVDTTVPQIIWSCCFSAFLILDFVFHVWQLSIAHNLSVVDTSVEIKNLRVAMIVTKAPSEPWEVVKTTLNAMLAQEIDCPYAVWLADEDPSEDTKLWCAENSVRISSRKGVDGYNNVDWPRRRKCKEGNLMFFYDKFGYDNYDVVFQFDSDHAPTPSYLKNSLPAFMDPEVSYIAMPNLNKKGSWISDARGIQEAWYCGPSQMSYSYDNMPMMTGSHYAVRTSALKEIGGIGPELDEDMNTTLMFASRGKKGVYAGNAIAYGDGPLSLEDAQKQEFQWAKSAIISFIRWKHIIYPPEGAAVKGALVRFLMIRMWYTVQLAFFVYMWVLIAPLVFVGSWCSSDECTLSFATLVLHCIPLLFANWGYEVMVRRNGWLRPNDTPFFSLDLIAYRILRPIWNTIGLIAGIIELIFNFVPSFSVTRKGDSSTSPLGVFTLWYLFVIPLYYSIFLVINLVKGVDIPIMIPVLYVSVILIYIYIVFRHFQDQKFKALTKMNYVGHAIVIATLIGSIVAFLVIFRSDIFTLNNAKVFIPTFTYKYDLWLTVAANGLSIVWGLIVAFM
ncbi:cellulose synthase catalytic subunit (UDP-forming) [Acanthocystis turfacea Chlorella virus NE-JV-2]|nr:cellulose synthase catalytic subunit (UDP-forming) [Acanthocystis turfacea Chlorella virus NE-JV-2]